MNWIKLKDKRPPNNTLVLVYTTLKSITIAQHIYYLGWHYLGRLPRDKGLYDNDITHWMPLPEAPKE